MNYLSSISLFTRKINSSFKLAVTLVVSFTLLLSSCTTDLGQYKSQSPRLDIKEFFTGDIIAWGMVQDYSSAVTRRFCVEINGQWQGNKGILAEKFYFDDGEYSVRNWQMTQFADGHYQGIAEDVVGIAKGQQQGFAFHWQYNLLVPIDDETYVFSMDDWMYQIDEYRLFNSTAMKKLGVEVAEITLFFDKNTADKKCNVKNITEVI